MAIELPAVDDGGELGPWQHDAACRGVAVDAFFPNNPDFVPPEVQALCMTCEVRADCLDHALANEAFGIWGGMSPDALRRLRRVRGVSLGPAGYAARAADLHQAGMSIDDIAVDLETTTRSVFRYLEDAGVPITGPEDHRRRPRTQEGA